MFPGSILGTADELINTVRIDVDAARFGWARASSTISALRTGKYERSELDDRDAVFTEVGENEEDFGRIL